MKKIFRMIVFSGLALFLTALWNKGFQVSFTPEVFLKALFLVAVLNYLIVPISKLVLLPLNILTLGLVSLLVYFLLFHFLLTRYSLVIIKGWVFPGFWLIGKTNINYWQNVLLSALSVTTIINFFEKTL